MFCSKVVNVLQGFTDKGKIFFVYFSPMLFIPKYGWAPYYDGSRVPVCLMPADTLWRELFFYMSSSLFFWVPLVVLLILYTVIAIHLMADPGIKVSIQAVGLKKLIANFENIPLGSGSCNCMKMLNGSPFNQLVSFMF